MSNEINIQSSLTVRGTQRNFKEDASSSKDIAVNVQDGEQTISASTKHVTPSESTAFTLESLSLRPRPMSTGISTPSSSKTPTSAVDTDIEQLLSREASAFQRELEVERILKAFKLKCVAVSCF